MSKKQATAYVTGIKQNTAAISTGHTTKKFAKSPSTVSQKPSPEQNPHFVLGYN